MSHAYGEVIRDGQVIGYFEYNGTCDVALPCIYDTRQEVSDHWRNGIPADCHCGNPSVDVVLYVDYGKGFHWDAQACLQCRAITKNFEPYYWIEDEEEPVGFPSKPTMIGPREGYPPL